VYFAGITLSFFASLWIIDRYVKRQLDNDKEKARRENEETKKIEEEVKQEYLLSKKSNFNKDGEGIIE
jgi:hypothetical protein